MEYPERQGGRKPCLNEAQLKQEIIKAWREIDQDKELCKRMICSIPKRLNAVIAKDGAQIQKEDYE